MNIIEEIQSKYAEIRQRNPPRKYINNKPRYRFIEFLELLVKVLNLI